MDQTSDSSFYYICEKGQLYTSQSKRRGAFESYTSRSLKRFQPDENKGSNYNATIPDQLSSAQLITEVASLKSLAMSFVAQNILSVESLVSFPQLIGKELFLTVNGLGLLSTPTKTCKLILKLFSDAYGSSLAEELSFDNKVSSLEFCFEPLTSFEHLVKLDLGGCKIWKVDDECLVFISSLSSLRYLSLKSTGIDNDGLRILTTVIAVYKKGLLQLNVLDLSCNQLINQKSLKFLHRFPALKALNLSSTNVFSISIEEQKNLRLTLLGGNLEYPFGKISVTTKGWVADVFNDWIADEVRQVDARAVCRSQPKLPWTAEDRLNASNFYRRSRTSFSNGRPKKNSIHVDQTKPDFHSTHSNLASKPHTKFTSEDCATNARAVHLVSAELIEEINGTKRMKDLSDPSTGRAVGSTPVSCATVELHSSGCIPSSRCGMRRTAAENSSGGHGNASDMRNSAPDSVMCKFLQKEATVVRNTVFRGAKPLSTHRKPVNVTENTNGDCANELKKKPTSLWVAMNSGLW